MARQVDKSHYEFEQYVTRQRWASIWHQIDEVSKLSSQTVLEIGPGAGLFRATASLFGHKVTTVDIDPDLAPDLVSSVCELPVADNEYDAVLCCQVLEHLPYSRTLDGVRELARVAAKNVIISLPDAQPVWVYQIHIPRIGLKTFHVRRPRFARTHVFNGEHYWEVNARGYPLKKIIEDFSGYGLILERTYRVQDNPYHRFFVFRVPERLLDGSDVVG